MAGVLTSSKLGGIRLLQKRVFVASTTPPPPPPPSAGFDPSPWRALSIAAEPRVIAIKDEPRNYLVTR